MDGQPDDLRALVDEALVKYIDEAHEEAKWESTRPHPDKGTLARMRAVAKNAELVYQLLLGETYVGSEL